MNLFEIAKIRMFMKAIKLGIVRFRQSKNKLDKKQIEWT